MRVDLGNPRGYRMVRGANGHLWFDAGPRARTATRLTRWEAGLALEWSAADTPTWLPAGFRVPALRLFDRAAIPETDPVGDFLAEIPVEARELAAPIAWQQLDVLQACRRDARAIELGPANRSLLWLLAEWCRKYPHRDLGRLLDGRRRDLLGAMFGIHAGTEARVRVLTRLEAPTLDERLLAPLSAFIGTRHLPDVVHHMPALPAALVIACHARIELLDLPLVRRELLRGITAVRIGELFRDLEDARTLARYLGVDIDSRLRGCGSYEGLVALHDELVGRRRDWSTVNAIIRRLGNEFPPPPLEGTETIVPIRTVADLAREGDVMHHCCLSYADRIAQGRCYLYRVLAPERGTLEISCADRAFALAQFKREANRTPTPEAFAAVQRWFAEAVARRAPST